jgi:cysteine desulfuration protein SufE
VLLWSGTLRTIPLQALESLEFFCPVITLASLKDDFQLLDDWEERFKYVIELGRGLEPLRETDRTPANKVQGCASQVWISTEIDKSGGAPVLRFTGDSDAILVKGLIAIAFLVYSGKPAAEIVASDAVAIFDELGLKDHLTPQRSNGLASMIGRIRRDAQAALA